MLGALIGAGASLLGGFLGQKQQNKMADKNIALQREFAQSGIQWKVEDARKAGIHPLYALGANTHSFSPVSVGSDLGSGIANAGQDIGRAMDATRSGSDRLTAFQKTVQDLSLQKMGLENELLASQIAKLRTTGSPPPMASPEDRMLLDGQAQSLAANDRVAKAFDLVETKPLQRTASDPSRPYQEAGAINDLGFVRTKDGYMPVQSNDAKQRLEDDLIGDLAWSLRNRILPSIGANQTPPNVPVGKGYRRWQFHPLYQEYRRTKDYPFFGEWFE